MGTSDSIYETDSLEDYPQDDAPELLGAPYLLEEFDEDLVQPIREEPLDVRIARHTYAYATRQEKYELYKRFKASLDPDSTRKRRRVKRY